MYVMVDIESDGPCPGKYSMVSFGAVVVEAGMDRSFYAQIKPISDEWIPEALAVSGHTREETLNFESPEVVMKRFAEWIKGLSSNPKNRPMFMSDNNGFDWQFINYYFHVYYGSNPLGFSSRNLGDIYKGMKNDMFASFKHLRKTKHTHHPVDDCKGNVEALLEMRKMGLKFPI